MNSSIDKVRTLTVKNAALRNHAALAQENIFDAAEKECARLMALIDGTRHVDVLLDDDKATQYQHWVMKRAGLMRLLAEHHQ